MKKTTLSGFCALNSFLGQAILIFVLTLACTAQLMSQPPKISVQGTLKSANGTPAPDGAQTITFRLYNAPTGGTPLWEETETVQVVGGIYSHYLGSVIPLNPSHFAQTLYLGVKVGTYELIPRNQLAYAPYAFSVNVAQKVVCSGAVGDVKYSVLNPTEFALRNGDCWVPMDGRPLDLDDSLRVIKGWAALPNAGGYFFRAQDFSNSDNDPDRTASSAIATAQPDALKNHAHTMNHAHSITDPEHTHGIVGWHGVGSASGNSKEAVSSETGLVDYAYPGKLGRLYTAPTGITVNQHTGDTGIAGQNANETRPKNMNLWVYIRIN